MHFRILLLSILATALAGVRILLAADQAPPCSLPVNVEMRLWGEILPKPLLRAQDSFILIVVHSTSVDPMQDGERVRVLAWRRAPLHRLAPGDRFCVRGRLVTATSARGTQQLAEYRCVAYFTPVADATLSISESSSASWRTLADRGCNIVERELKARLSPQAAALAAAKQVGRRQGIDDELNAAYMQAGVVHVLSISGLHLGVMFVAFGFLLARLGASPSMRAITLVALGCAYAVLVDLRPPVLRAATMAGLIQLAPLFRRRGDSWTALGIAYCIGLAIQPRWLLSPEFQLSYAAVIAILAVTRGDGLDPDSRLASILLPTPLTSWRRVKLSLLITAAVTVVTTPITAYHFQRVGPAGFIGNLVVVPISSAGLILGWLVLLPWIGEIFVTPLEICTSLELYFVVLIAAIPGQLAIIVRPEAWHLLVYGVAMLALICFARRPRVGLFMVMLAATILWLARPVPLGLHPLHEGKSGSAMLHKSATSITLDVPSGLAPTRVARALVYRGVGHLDRIEIESPASLPAWRRALAIEGIVTAAIVLRPPR